MRAAILALGSDPRPTGVTKLRGQEAYRIRIGDYRVVYVIRDSELLVVVIRTGHRSDIYQEKS